MQCSGSLWTKRIAAASPPQPAAREESSLVAMPWEAQRCEGEAEMSSPRGEELEMSLREGARAPHAQGRDEPNPRGRSVALTGNRAR